MRRRDSRNNLSLSSCITVIEKSDAKSQTNHTWNVLAQWDNNSLREEVYNAQRIHVWNWEQSQPRATVQPLHLSVYETSKVYPNYLYPTKFLQAVKRYTMRKHMKNILVIKHDVIYECTNRNKNSGKKKYTNSFFRLGVLSRSYASSQ